MRSPTAREAFLHAEQIELESRAFYSEAAWRMSELGARILLLGLAEEETRHAERVRGLAERLAGPEDAPLPGPDLTREGQLVGAQGIPEGALPEEILRRALEREEHTQQMYTTLLALTDLPRDAVAALEELRLQEQGHATRIRRLLAQF